MEDGSDRFDTDTLRVLPGPPAAILVPEGIRTWTDVTKIGSRLLCKKKPDF